MIPYKIKWTHLRKFRTPFIWDFVRFFWKLWFEEILTLFKKRKSATNSTKLCSFSNSRLSVEISLLKNFKCSVIGHLLSWILALTTPYRLYPNFSLLKWFCMYILGLNTNLIQNLAEGPFVLYFLFILHLPTGTKSNDRVGQTDIQKNKYLIVKHTNWNDKNII